MKNLIITQSIIANLFEDIILLSKKARKVILIKKEMTNIYLLMKGITKNNGVISL